MNPFSTPNRFKNNHGSTLILVITTIGCLSLLLLFFFNTTFFQKKLEHSLANQMLVREYAKIGFQSALHHLQSTAGIDTCITYEGSLLKDTLTIHSNNAITIPKELLFSHEQNISINEIHFEQGSFGFYIEDLGLYPSTHTPHLGIPVNPITGGLKKNLWLDRSLKGSIYDSQASPSWSQLYSFLDVIKNNNGSPITPIPSINAYYPCAHKLSEQLTPPTSVSIGPILQDCTLGFSIEKLPKRTTSGFCFIKVGLQVQLTLWNPYDVALANFPYTFEIFTSDPQATLLLNHQHLSLPQKGKLLFKGHTYAAFKPGEIKTFTVTSGPLDLENGNVLQDLIHGTNGAAYFEPIYYFIKSNNPTLERKHIFPLTLRLSPKDASSYTFFQEIRDMNSVGATKADFNWDITSLAQPSFSIHLASSIHHYNLRAPLIEGTYLYNHNLYPNTNYWLATWHTGSLSSTFGNYLPPIYHLPTASEVLSLASLRWAPFTFLGDEPSFPFADSTPPKWATPNTPFLKNIRKGVHFQEETTTLYDHSYLLNEALWGRVYLSNTHSPLALLPSFNINSTSAKAWEQMLGKVPKLNFEEKKRLAVAIAEEVKKRGPFYSVAQFVNRKLTETQELEIYGTLEAAIRKSHLETKISQAELLECIGNLMTVRSDTFRIIAFGKIPRGPTQSSKMMWCEAVVQREFEFVESLQNQPTDAPENLSPINRALGRRFKVKHFSWMDLK